MDTGARLGVRQPADRVRLGVPRRAQQAGEGARRSARHPTPVRRRPRMASDGDQGRCRRAAIHRYSFFTRWIMKRIVSKAGGDTDTSRITNTPTGTTCGSSPGSSAAASRRPRPPDRKTPHGGVFRWAPRISPHAATTGGQIGPVWRASGRHARCIPYSEGQPCLTPRSICAFRIPLATSNSFTRSPLTVMAGGCTPRLMGAASTSTATTGKPWSGRSTGCGPPEAGSPRNRRRRWHAHWPRRWSPR